MSSLPSANAINSPMSQWTTLNSMLSATTPSSSSCVFSTMPDLIPGSNGSTGSSITSNSNFSPSTAPSSLLATPENSYAQIMQKGFNIPNTSSNSSTYSPSPMSQHSLPPPVPTSNDIITSPQVQNGLPPLSCQSQQLQQGASTVPTPTCGLAFQTPTFVQDLSIYQSQQPHSQSISSPHAHHHQPQQSQYQQQEHQQQAFPYQQQQQQAFTPGGMVSPHANAPDLSFPTELFFDNLCMWRSDHLCEAQHGRQIMVIADTLVLDVFFGPLVYMFGDSRALFYRWVIYTSSLHIQGTYGCSNKDVLSMSLFPVIMPYVNYMSDRVLVLLVFSFPLCTFSLRNILQYRRIWSSFLFYCILGLNPLSGISSQRWKSDTYHHVAVLSSLQSYRSFTSFCEYLFDLFTALSLTLRSQSGAMQCKGGYHVFILFN